MAVITLNRIPALTTGFYDVAIRKVTVEETNEGHPLLVFRTTTDADQTAWVRVRLDIAWQVERMARSLGVAADQLDTDALVGQAARIEVRADADGRLWANFVTPREEEDEKAGKKRRAATPAPGNDEAF